MGKERRILVPFHLCPTLGPFKIQLGLIEFHIRAQQIFKRIPNLGIRQELPEHFILITGAGNTPQAWLLCRMSGLQVKYRPTLGMGAAQFDLAINRIAQFPQPFRANQGWHDDRAILEIFFPLCLAQNLGRTAHYVFFAHRPITSSVS